MESTPDRDISDIGIQNSGLLPDEDDQGDSDNSGPGDNLDSLFEDEDEDENSDDDENREEHFQYDQSGASSFQSERLSREEEMLEDSQDEKDTEIVSEKVKSIERALDQSDSSDEYSESSSPSLFRNAPAPRERWSQGHGEEEWPGLQEWMEKHTKIQKTLVPPKEPGSKGSEVTSCVLVRPAREQAVIFSAPFTLATFFQLARMLYPASPPERLSLFVHFQHVKDFDRTGILLDEQIDMENSDSLARLNRDFAPNIIDGEEIYVLRRFSTIVLRDGRNLLNEIDYSLSLEADTVEEMKENFGQAVQALFARRSAVDGQQHVESVRIQVDRFKCEWLEWSERMNNNAFLHDVIFKIDDSTLNVYPSGWFPDRSFEEAEEELRRIAKSEADQPSPQTPARNEAEDAYNEWIQQTEGRLQAEEERIVEERLKLSKTAQILARKSMALEKSSNKLVLTSCPVQDCETNLANAQGIVTQEALSYHYDGHLVDIFKSREGRCKVSTCHALLTQPFMIPDQINEHLSLHPENFDTKSDGVANKSTQVERVSMIDAQSETADELEPQVTNQIDPSPRMCSVEKCNAKLHDMSDIQLTEHVKMHSESLSAPQQQCPHDVRCWAFFDDLTEDQRKSHDEMHSEINRDQNASTTLEICPHKNCLAHLEFLNDEERKLHLRMHASNRSTICSIPGCKVKISQMRIEEILQHFEDYHLPTEDNKRPSQSEEESRVPTKKRKASAKGQVETVPGEPAAKPVQESVASSKDLEKEQPPLHNVSDASSSPSLSPIHAGQSAVKDKATLEHLLEHEHSSEPSNIEDTQSDASGDTSSYGYSHQEDKVYRWKYCYTCMSFLHSMSDARRTAHLQSHNTDDSHMIFFESKELASAEVERRKEDYGSFVEKHRKWFEAQQPGDDLLEESKVLYDRIARYLDFLTEAKKKDKKSLKKPTKGDDEDKGKAASKTKDNVIGKKKEKTTSANSKAKPAGRPKGKSSQKGAQTEDVDKNDTEGFEADTEVEVRDIEAEDSDAELDRLIKIHYQELANRQLEPSPGPSRPTVARKTLPGTKRKAEEELAEEEDDDDEVSSSSSSSGDEVGVPRRKKAKLRK